MQSSSPDPSSTIRLAGIVAVVAALLAVVADLALQYTSNAAHLLSKQALYLLDVPPGRMLLGHYLGVIAILVETVGFWPVYRALRPAGERHALPFFLVSAFGAMLGAAFHATFVFVGLTLQAQSTSLGAASEAFDGLLAGFASARVGLAVPAILAIVLSSLWYAWVVGTKSSGYPRWMALCNPLIFLLMIAMISAGVRPLALVLAPTALNASHLLFFLGSTAALWNTSGL